MSASILANLSIKIGKTTTPSGNTANVVMETAELRRIRDAPRREWQEHPDLDLLVDTLTRAYRTPKGNQILRPVQAATLSELYEHRGAFVTSRVGAGKTLCGALAPVVLDDMTPAIYITRGGVVRDTRKALFELADHWQIRPITVTSYSQLALDYENVILGKLKPKLIVCDESDALQSPKSSAWKVIHHYVSELRRLEKIEGTGHGSKCVFMAMCGTPTDQSIKQYWHIIRLALGERAPVPRDFHEKNQWCWALDEKVTPESRWQPGALVRLDLNATGETELLRARNAYGSRFKSTAAVITTGDARPPNLLEIRGVELKAPPVLASMVRTMRATYETPDEHPFEMPMELWRHCREMQCGFYHVWDPRPPHEWLRVRKEWMEWRNAVLADSRTYRTPGHLVRGIEAGKVDDEGLWMAWKAMNPTFRPNPVPVWVDDTTLDYCAEWLEANPTGLCWAEFKALGFELSKRTGIPYYRAKGMDARGNCLSDHPRGKPAIASVKGCSYGLNLQRIFDRNLYASPMSTNKMWEQSLGRTHRDGQLSPTVTAEVLMMVSEAYSSMVYAIRKAEMVQATMKQGQKLVYADVRDFAGIEHLIARRDDQMWLQEIEAA